MKRAAILACLLAGAAAHADTLGVHLGSVHDRPGYNDANPGVYYRASNGLTAGAYYNSERADSVYAGYTRPVGPVDVSLVLVTGYSVAEVLPAVIPSYALQLGGGVALRTSLVLNPYGASAVHFSIEVRR